MSRLFALLLALPFLFCFCKNEKKPAAGDPGAGVNPELAALNAAVEEHPTDDSLRFRRAEMLYKLEGYDEALNDLSEALRLDSLQPNYYHLMADVLMDYGRPGDSKRALDVLKACAAKFPGRIPTLLKLSEFQLIVRQHNDALSTINQIFQRDPQNAEGYFMTGRVALDMGDTTRAVAALQKAVQLDAANSDAWIFLGRIFSNRNNPKAVQYFDNALALDSTNLDAREFKANFYVQQREYAKALALYRDIIDRNPDYAAAYFDMGIIYFNQDSLEKAYANFDLATKTDPLFVDAYYHRGIVAEAQGKLAEALKDYRQAAKMSPQYEEVVKAEARLDKQLKGGK